MDCWHPIEIRNKGYDDLFAKYCNMQFLAESERVPFLFADFDFAKELEKLQLLLELTPEYVQCPCRKCPPCLKKRSSEWNGRLLRETLYWMSKGGKVLFCTFTYAPKYISKARATYKQDINKFFDSLRSKYRRTFRHWCIPELGEKNGRFHIHALIFDVPDDFAPDSHFHRSKNGAIMGSNKVFRERWPKGLNDVGFLKEPKGVSYMVSYLTKISESSLKANNGFLFKGGIVCSNKLGFLDVDNKEIDDVVRKIQSNESATYNIGQFTFSYPQSWLKSNVTPINLRYSSYNNSLKRYLKGGDFVFHSNYYSTYKEYKMKLEVALRGVTYYHNPVYYGNIDIDNNYNFLIENLI